MFERYRQVANLSISGRINSLAPRTFQHQMNIHYLQKGLGKTPTQNCSLDHNFLSPLSKVMTIEFSESFILQGSEYLIQSLHHTINLIINNMDGYKSCPAYANKLFRNIPASVTDLQATHWTTIQPIAANCMLTSKTFNYLSTRGSRIREISFV